MTKEKDKIRLEEQARKYSAEKKKREQRLLNSILKDEKRVKENGPLAIFICSNRYSLLPSR